MTDVQPQNVEAEDAVLGAILQSENALDTATQTLTPNDFYPGKNGAIFQAALRLQARGEPVDPVTLAAELGDDTYPRLRELVASTHATANVSHYAGLVKKASVARGLIRAGQEISKLGWDETEDGQDKAETIMYGLSEKSSTDDVDLSAAVHRTYDEITSGRRDLLGVPTGLGDLDRLTRGFRPGGLVVMAADTGRGKSALALNAAMHLLGQGRPVAFYSLEMSEVELIQRALSLESGIPHDRLSRGDIRPDEHSRLADACEMVSKAPLKLRTDATIRPSGIRSELRRWKARNPDAALAIVDYLQLLTPDEKTDNRTVDVSEISRALKVTAMSLQLPIVAISQFHRRVNLDERPHRSNLRESGSIENDADVVLLVHRPSKWDTDPQRAGTAELILAKNRHGMEDVVSVKWWGDQMRFGNLIHDARAVA